MVPVLLAVNCIPLTISLLLASILGRFTSLTRHKEVWVVLGTVLMLVVVLGLEWSILPKIPEDADAAFFAQMLTGVQPMLRSFIHAFPPVAWAVDGIAGDWLQWLAFLAVSIGGAALVIAGLMARGVTEIYEPEYIDRGYEHLEDKLCSLGAEIRREKFE